jgi:hypothetical protein
VTDPTRRPGPGRQTILVVGTDDWAIEQAAATLARSGHPVLRCHEPGEPAFPCNALREGGVCPLDVGFDLVLDVRSRPATTPTVGEMGVVCAVHRGAPLLVAGLSNGNPFLPWAEAVVDTEDDLPTAVGRIHRTVDLSDPVAPSPI